MASRASDLSQELEAAALHFAESENWAAIKRARKAPLPEQVEASVRANRAQEELLLIAVAFAAAVKRGD